MKNINRNSTDLPPPESPAPDSPAPDSPAPDSPAPDSPAVEQLEQHALQPELGFWVEFYGFLRENKKWWLLPLVASLMFVAAISVLAASGAAPFIYTIF